ncbi:hypothetical protein BO86DRAFT_386955 [Aspergillus japonicus CBS 114.51]|uniref:Uncharacterized protein n=2 Tax=Aspergillus TaxID=5052 RepID=A0A2V5HI39_ASPV1|nr:hypothetical protein BO86DRAFT_386955 [Aspergillus japonicus CBS 114.51]PYI23481.1 hypothetical protein BO99DRAFT_399006 [Aspergillus violaceofuscus CBS 115571]RAH84312.1 hypothetical protein BO86DRAFT_386955 [Aspergillus japonicus CBS 114.51]
MMWVCPGVKLCWITDASARDDWLVTQRFLRWGILGVLYGVQYLLLGTIQAEIGAGG